MPWINKGNLKGPQGIQGPQGVPGEVAAVKPDTLYTAGALAVSPDGDVVSAKESFTTGSSYDATKWNPSTQNGRIGALEALRPVKSVRLEAGKWVWDLANATHYIFPDHMGALIVRAAPHPVPDATPSLTW